MSVHKAYPRTPLEQSGQVNPRSESYRSSIDFYHKSGLLRLGRKGVPDCTVVMCHDRRSGEMKQSEPYYRSQTEVALLLMPRKMFQRYRVNVYLK